MMRIRRALQRWIADYPKIVGTDLMVITTEFNDWELGCDCSSLGRKGELVLFTEALYAFVIDLQAVQIGLPRATRFGLRAARPAPPT
jgi:hypothetical protein